MTARQIIRIQEQLPTGSKVLRAYRAMEGDIRVIVQLPDDTCEMRYTVSFEDGSPRTRRMP